MKGRGAHLLASTLKLVSPSGGDVSLSRELAILDSRLTLSDLLLEAIDLVLVHLEHHLIRHELFKGDAGQQPSFRKTNGGGTHNSSLSLGDDHLGSSSELEGAEGLDRLFNVGGDGTDDGDARFARQRRLQ
jgi:hypothetical protein